MSRLNRRALFGAGAALLTAGAATAQATGQGASIQPPPAPDADLLALCAEFDRNQTTIDRLSSGVPRIEDDAALEAEIDRLDDQLDAIAEKLWATRATTVEGIRAKARSFVLYAPDWTSEHIIDWNGEFTASIIRDVLELG